MLHPVYLPENIEVAEEGENTATFVMHPYHPGYGPTVANALRRVLLSSLPGAAITRVKIEGVDHEFTTIEGVKENLLTLLLNFKQVRLRSTSDAPAEIRLKVSGEKKVTAGDFETPPEISIANPDFLVATLTDSKAQLELRCTVEQGRGYVPTEERRDDAREIGVIAIDAVFSPVRRVSFNVENVRVGQDTDYHKLTITIATDGTVEPQEALKMAASILADHFKQLTGDYATALTSERQAETQEASEPLDSSQEAENTLNLLMLPSRVHNALERVGITTVEQVMELTDEQVQDIPGLGSKAIDDISSARNSYTAKTESSNET